jgi:hypothetical protein
VPLYKKNTMYHHLIKQTDNVENIPLKNKKHTTRIALRVRHANFDWNDRYNSERCKYQQYKLIQKDSLNMFEAFQQLKEIADSQSHPIGVVENKIKTIENMTIIAESNINSAQASSYYSNLMTTVLLSGVGGIAIGGPIAILAGINIWMGCISGAMVGSVVGNKFYKS